MKVRSGIDSVHIPRIEKLLAGHGDAFVKRTFTERENEYADSLSSEKRRAEVYAGRFAAKEAASKAIGTGILTEGIALTDFEIITDEAGAPEIIFHGKAKERAQELHVTSASVSITHEKDYAAAVCVLLCDEEV